MSPAASSAPSPPRRALARPTARAAFAILGATVLGVLLFRLAGAPLLQHVGLPHEVCYLRDPRLVWLHVGTDALIGLAYVSISITLGWLAWRASHGIPFNWVFVAFGLFIVTCGFTHFMDVWVVWQPVYWLSAYIKIITAAASVATAVAIVPLVPRVLALVDQASRSEAQRLEIGRLNQDLERFNYSVAHDLRAPLRGISALAQILAEDHAGELGAEAREHLRRMQGSVARMDGLITGLLQYATIGRQEFVVQDIDLRGVVREVLQLLDAELARRGAQVEVLEPLPGVRGDPLLLQVVLQNLLGNAVKFVEPGRTPLVVVSGALVEVGRVEISVTDNGVGVPASARRRIFGIFERVDVREPGTGIGLALVQRAVERMGGENGVEPAAPGPGSRFWVRLPAAVTVRANRNGRSTRSDGPPT
jgi:signal transduction histidine kinase